MRSSTVLILVLSALALTAPGLAQTQDPVDVGSGAATGVEAPARASESNAEDELPENAMPLLSSFASGYFEMAAICALELYTTAGIIYMDYNQGVASAEEALDALENPALLHSSVTTSLANIYNSTRENQQDLRVELEDLAAVYDALGEMYTLLLDAFSEPERDFSTEIETAREGVQQTINAYFEAKTLGQD